MRSGIMGERDNMVTMHDLLDAQVGCAGCTRLHGRDARVSAPAALPAAMHALRAGSSPLCSSVQLGERMRGALLHQTVQLARGSSAAHGPAALMP